MKLFISLILAFSIQSLPALAQSDCPKILALLNQGSPILPPNRLLAKNLAPQFQETFQKLLKEIDSAPNLPNPADHYLIRSMMEQGKLFAAAKMLRVNGKQEIAEKIIDFTEQLLLHDRVIHFENMKDITRSEEFIKENLYKVKLESGIEAVMKVDRADWRQQSLMVSQLEDQHTKIEPAVSDISRVIAKGLGQDLVPPTVQRSHVEGFPTRRKVSLQYFESDAAANEAEKIGPQQQRILDAFDSLIMNNDRHDGNFLAFKINSAEDHHAIAIDNAAALKNFPGTRFYLKLHELDYQQARFFEAIENHLTEEKIREILIKHELPQFTRSLSQSRRALLENYRAWSALKNQGHGIASAASAIQSFLIANEELVSKMKIEGEALLNMARKVGMGANREEARK